MYINERSIRKDLNESLNAARKSLTALEHIEYRYKKNGEPFKNWNQGLINAEYSKEDGLHAYYYDETTHASGRFSCGKWALRNVTTFEELKEFISAQIARYKEEVITYKYQISEVNGAMEEFGDTMNKLLEYFEGRYSCMKAVLYGTRF